MSFPIVDLGPRRTSPSKPASPRVAEVELAPAVDRTDPEPHLEAYLHQLRGSPGESTATVAEIMTKSVITVSDQATAAFARELMEHHEIRHLPVLDTRGLVGIVSDRDLRRYDHPSEAKVTEVMSNPVVTVQPTTTLPEFAATLVARQLGAAPVVDRGQLVGIVTYTDVLRHVVRQPHIDSWA